MESLKVKLQICDKANLAAIQAVGVYQNTLNFHGKPLNWNMIARGNGE